MSQNFQLATTDGLTLVGTYQKPLHEIKGVIAIIHGMGEHFGRYRHVAQFFANAGYATIGIDHRGHGRSEGKRGHAPSLDHLMDNIALLLKKAGELFGDLPLVLYGHSLGGNLAANYVLRRKPKLKGLVLTSPYLKLAFSPPGWKVALAKGLAKILPSTTLPTELEEAALSRNQNVVKDYRNDPLVHDKMSASFFAAVHPAALYAIEHAGELRVPTLVMHGTGDRITSPEGSKEFAQNNTQFVTLKLWESLYHETHNEPEKDQVLNYIIQWLGKL